MDDKYNHDAVMEIIEKQKLIADHFKGMRANFFWSDGLELLCSPSIENVPGNAWADLPQYPNLEKWADKLFSKCTRVLPHISGHSGMVGAIASAVIAKSQESQEIMNRATRLANLEWQLQHLTYWSAPTTHEPKKNRKTFDELNRQRELLRDSALEALCLYQCGAHDFLNDFERYNSHAVGDINCAEQYKAAFNKMMALVTTYRTEFDYYESKADIRKGKTNKNRHLVLWLEEKFKNGRNFSADQLWNSIARDVGDATETPESGEMYIELDAKDNKEKLYIVGQAGKPITISTFRSYVTKVFNKN